MTAVTGCWARHAPGLVRAALLREAAARAGAGGGVVFDAGEAGFGAHGEAATIRVGDAGELIALQPDHDKDRFRLAARTRDKSGASWQQVSDVADAIAAALGLRFASSEGAQLAAERLRERDEALDTLDITEVQLQLQLRAAGSTEPLAHTRTLAAAPLASIRRGQLDQLEDATTTAASAAFQAVEPNESPPGIDDLASCLDGYEILERGDDVLRVRPDDDEACERIASVLFLSDRVELLTWPATDLDLHSALVENATMRVAMLAIDEDGEWALRAIRRREHVRCEGRLSLLAWLDAFFEDRDRVEAEHPADDDESDEDDDEEDDEDDDADDESAEG